MIDNQGSKANHVLLTPQVVEKEEDPPLATAWCSLEANLKNLERTDQGHRDNVVPTFSSVADVGLVYRVANLEISDIWVEGVTACRTDVGN